MSEQTTEMKERATKIMQGHLDNLIQACKKNEIIVTSTPDLSVQKLMAIYEEQRIIEGAIGWIINVEKRINPAKILAGSTPIITGK